MVSDVLKDGTMGLGHGWCTDLRVMGMARTGCDPVVHDGPS